jgi:hypothetical protein
MGTRTKGGVTALWVALAFAVVVLADAGLAGAQTPFVHGQNMVRYRSSLDVYDRAFRIYYYPEIEKHLERVASYAESAYQQVSADLKHDLAFKVPMIIFKTTG